MKKGMKKLLSILLMAFLAASFIPVGMDTVLAEDTGYVEDEAALRTSVTETVYSGGTITADGDITLSSSLTSADVCEIGETSYPTLDEALEEVLDGQTIRLLGHVTHESQIKVKDKSFTIDVNNYTLTIKTVDDDGIYSAYGESLSIVDSGASETGALVVDASGESLSGLYASGEGSKISIEVPAAINVTADNSNGIYAYGGAEVYLNGNVTVEGDALSHGAFAESGSKGGLITIDGIITVGGGANKIRINLTEFEGLLVSNEKPGYLAFQSPGDTATPKSTVWVKAEDSTTTPICQIGETEYTTLEAAITAALLLENPTIKLLRSITTDKPINITYENDTDIEFDLDGYDLTVDSHSIPNSTALELDGGSITLKEGPGSFNVSGAFCGVGVSDGAKAVVTSAEAADEWGVAVSAGGDGSLIQVGGNVTASGTGSVGVRASNNACIEIAGNIEVDGNDGIGIMALTTGTVTLTGNITVTGEDAVGVLADGGGEIVIDGTIDAEPYIKIGDVIKAKGDYTSTEGGYHIYTDGISVVRVKSGLVWQEQTIESFESGIPVGWIDYRDSCYGGGIYAAVGLYGTILTSVDEGETWQFAYGGNFGDPDLKGVTYGNGKFVAVGSNYIYTKESGQNWSSKTLEGASGMPDFQDIAFSSGVDSSSGIFVAVGDKTLWWSEDGDNWTEVTSGRPNPLNGFFLSGVAADGAGHFVAVGSYKKPDNTNSGYLIWKSADGKSWTNVTNAAPALPASGIMHGVAYGDNTFVAVGGAGSEAWISNDLGSSWTTGEGMGSTMSGITYGDGYFAGKAGSEIFISDDGGHTWTTSLEKEQMVLSVSFGNNAFIAIIDGDFNKANHIYKANTGVLTTYTIAPISDQAMTSLTAGYNDGTQEIKTITITKTGSGDLKNLAVSLSGMDADSFNLTQPLVTTLDGSTTSTTFTIKAKNGLAAGLYCANVTVSADNMIPVVFSVTQEVTASSSEPLAIATASLPGGKKGVAYSYTLQGSGGKPPYTWQGSGLPPGLSLNTNTGVISGTPTASGTYTVTLTMSDSAGGDAGSASKNLQLVIGASSSGGGGGGGTTTLNISMASPPDGKEDIDFTHIFKATGGRSPYSFEVTGGALPEGVSLAKDGTLKGKPIIAGSYKFTITVRDANGRTSSHTFTWVVKKGDPTVPPAPQREIILNVGILLASVNGQPLTLEAGPFIDTGTNRTLVPIRFIGEALGAHIEWNNVTDQVIIKDGDQEIVLTIGSRNVLVNGVQHEIDCAPIILPPGRTFVPVRFVSETLGAAVDYDKTNKQISIRR